MKRGEVDGLVKTRSGVEVFTTTRLAKNPGKAPSVVVLFGIACEAGPYAQFQNTLKKLGVSNLGIVAGGQGETHLAALTKRSASPASLPLEKQAGLVIETLDALNLKRPVNIAGLSYGGGLAAMVRKLFPDRIGKLLMVAPLTEAHSSLAMASSSMPFVASSAKAAIRSELMRRYPTIPSVFRDRPRDFYDGVLQQTLGIAGFRLSDVVRDMRDVHLFVGKEDVNSPLVHNRQAYDAIESGSLSHPDPALAAVHQLFNTRPDISGGWIRNVLLRKAG